jgi:ribosomal protein S27E
MIRLRYNLVRWVIAVLTLILIALHILVQPTGGVLVLFVLLLLASAGAIVYPPGLYVWLLMPICPDCQRRVAWAIEQGSQNPYLEKLVVRCPDCDREKVEFSFDPT